MKRKKLRLGLACALGMLASGQAVAGWLPAFEGFSVFGDTDGDAASTSCFLCDSTVSFAVYENTDGNWEDDADFSTPATALGSSDGSFSGAGSVDSSAQFVYLYQVANTDALGGANNALDNFNISFGPVGAPNPFTSGGYFANTGFANLSTASLPLDVPNDGSPSGIGLITPFINDNTLVNPNDLLVSSISTDSFQTNPISAGVLFGWDSPDLAADDVSTVMFLTSEYAPTFGWAETENPGGIGAAGDVATTAVPVPAAVWLLGSGLLGFVTMRRAQSKKEITAV